ncbi:aldo/keto reductase [uncultured Selenomonas sp.]|uniref:aldo/keto reductase n=1 Tax=uncultured Selenomonas sp. TaxID=159275 RepID=UPI0028D1D762|nr:aldo/keto reductase [uncultured Selenomonas sp.]
MTAKLCLGTVQFGMHYGIHNTLGRQPTEEEVFGILDAALDTGICMFDTASAYGTSEEMLGRYRLSGRGGQIISKLHPAVDGERRDVRNEIQRSLTRLSASRLYCYMLHRVEDMDDVSVMDAMEDAKARGWTDKIGVSIYAPEDAMRAAEDPRIDIIQVPYNVLDQRLDGCGFFAYAKENGKEVFARSSFLQGLLLMSSADAEAKVAGSGVYVERFQAMAAEDGFLPREAAMLYTLCHAGISYVVFGVDTSAQLNENADLLSRCHTFSATYQKLYGAFRDIDVNILEPQRWKVCL